MSAIAGRMAIVLAVLALAPSIVPGAISMFGLIISMSALVLSLFSIRQKGDRYFRTTAVIVLGGVFLVNDGLRIWDPLPLPINVKLGLYGMTALVFSVCALIACRLRRNAG